MRYSELKNCDITTTSHVCPACNSHFLEKLEPNDSTDIAKIDFDYYLLCPNPDCFFMGSPHCCQVDLIYKNLTLLGMTMIDFTSNKDVVYTGEEVIFTIRLIGYDITAFRWDFGDGYTGNTSDKKINHIYKLPGDYSVNLNITDNISKTDKNIFKPGMIKVRQYESPKASMILDGKIIADLPIYYYNKAKITFDARGSFGSNIIKYEWSIFNSTDLSQPPYAEFEGELVDFEIRDIGKYTVRLSITNDRLNINHQVEPESLIIQKTAPAADMDADVRTGVVPLTVNFQYDPKDVGYHVDNVLWDFGDGTTCTDLNPTHTYMSSGTYDVILKVSNTISGITNTNTEKYEKFIDVLPMSYSYTT